MVDLVPSDLPATEATPFALRVQDSAVSKRIQTALYRVTGDENGKVDATTQAKAVEFTYQDAGGLSVKKLLRFEPSRNIVTLTADVRWDRRRSIPRCCGGRALATRARAPAVAAS